MSSAAPADLSEKHLNFNVEALICFPALWLRGGRLFPGPDASIQEADGTLKPRGVNIHEAAHAAGGDRCHGEPSFRV